MNKLKRRTTGGEGETARDALEGLAHGLRDGEVDDDDGVIVIELRRARIRCLGAETYYDGFAATVVTSDAKSVGFRKGVEAAAKVARERSVYFAKLRDTSSMEQDENELRAEEGEAMTQHIRALLTAPAPKVPRE